MGFYRYLSDHFSFYFLWSFCCSIHLHYFQCTVAIFIIAVMHHTVCVHKKQTCIQCHTYMNTSIHLQCALFVLCMYACITVSKIYAYIYAYTLFKYFVCRCMYNMYMCVCISVHAFACIHTHICVYGICIHIYRYMHVYIYPCMHTYLQLYMYTHEYLRISMSWLACSSYMHP